MKLSDLIDKLIVLHDKHGDLTCIDSYDHPIDDPEEVEGFVVIEPDKDRTVGE